MRGEIRKKAWAWAIQKTKRKLSESTFRSMRLTSDSMRIEPAMQAAFTGDSDSGDIPEVGIDTKHGFEEEASKENSAHETIKGKSCKERKTEGGKGWYPHQAKGRKGCARRFGISGEPFSSASISLAIT